MNRPWKAWSRRNRLWRSYRVALLLLRTLYIINRERSRVMRARARGDYQTRPDVEALVRVLRDFRQTAVALGGLLIKLGQFLGARADLLPQEALAELAALHDEVPAERFEDIAATLERQWRASLAEVCAAVEAKPAGSASLGQVHRAELRDGRRVAIKVQRPGIAAIVRTDLRTLRFVLRVVAWLVPAANRITDLDALYAEFGRTVAEELDYRQEARNAQRFAALFADDPAIRVPAVVEEYSTRRVLVLEWMDGIKITEVDRLDAAGVDRPRLARRLTEAYLRQALDAGFFHADPHPGNLLVQPGEEGDRLVFLDFGMMGLVTPRLRGGLRDTLVGVIAQDPDLIVRGLDALGFLAPAVDRDAIARVVGAMLARFGAAPARGHDGGDPREVLGDMETTLYDQPFRLPAQFAFFGRMAGILLGVIYALEPDFDFAGVAAPYARRFMGRGGADGIARLLGAESLEALGRDLLRGGIAAVRGAAAVPSRLDRLLERAERGQLRLIVESAEASNHANRRGVASLLSRPVPAWLPLGLIGAAALARLTIGRADLEARGRGVRQRVPAATGRLRSRDTRPAGTRRARKSTWAGLRRGAQNR